MLSTCFNIQKFCILPTECFYVFYTIYTMKSDFFPLTSINRSVFVMEMQFSAR